MSRAGMGKLNREEFSRSTSRGNSKPGVIRPDEVAEHETEQRRRRWNAPSSPVVQRIIEKTLAEPALPRKGIDRETVPIRKAELLLLDRAIAEGSYMGPAACRVQQRALALVERLLGKLELP